MNKTEGRRLRVLRLYNAIKAMVGYADCLIDGIGRPPVLRGMVTFSPENFIGGPAFVERSDSDAFDASQLFYTAPWRRLVSKTKTVHGPDDFQTKLVGQRSFCLVRRPVCPGSAGLSGRVWTPPSFTCPEKRCSTICARATAASVPVIPGSHSKQAIYHQEESAFVHLRCSQGQESHLPYPDGRNVKTAWRCVF